MSYVLDQDADPPVPPRSDFTTTHWSVVIAAGRDSSPGSQAALEKLCQVYWYPLYAYTRRQGHSPEDAQDLTQDFFARLLRKDYLERADHQRGRFRTFLLTSLKRFLVNEWEKGKTRKRGGGQTVITWSPEAIEIRYQDDSKEDSTPERIYEKRWAMTLLDQALTRLRDEFIAKGKVAQFERLKVLLWGEGDAPAYTDVADELGLTQGAIKVAVHRLRKRYRELLRSEVAHTVAHAEEVDDELRHLIAVISN